MKAIRALATSLTLFIGSSCTPTKETQVAGAEIANLPEVKIGNQIWTPANLDISTFRNGDTIPEAKDPAQWTALGLEGKPACCYNRNDSVGAKKYGRLYNWYAVHDPRGLAPTGWHIATDGEWIELCHYLGGDSTASPKLKSSSGWFFNIPLEGPAKDGNGNNESGFTGLPGGYRMTNDLLGDVFGCIGCFGFWWTATEADRDYAWTRGLSGTHDRVDRFAGQKSDGNSVRCVKD